MSERPRASDARQSMMRAFSVPSRTTPQPVSDDEVVPETVTGEGQQAQAAERPVRSSRPAPAGTTKYTANLDADTAAEFDGLALAARRKLGRRVDKSEVMKALIRLAADDASLREQMIGQLGPELERRG